MKRPLISHPTRDTEPQTYSDEDLTDQGDLRLTAHNRVVAARALRFYNSRGGDAEYLHAASALHDFGKVTPQFQAYVRPEETASCPDEQTRHARLGALATWYVLGKLDAPARHRLAGTLAVARHHQALPNAAQYTSEPLARAFERNDSTIQAQLNGIDTTWPDAATALLSQTGLQEPDWSEFYTWAASGSVADELRGVSARTTLGGHTPDTTALPKKLYDRTLRYWSSLTLADKSHAMDIEDARLFELDTLNRATIERHIATLREDAPESGLEARLNDARERARRQSVRGVHQWLASTESQIATLTLPTGLGKTFTGLSCAFEARDVLSARDDGSGTRQIIYALPFTSIIEQTRELFENSDLWGADPTKSGLTVHHYLSETLVQHDDYEDRDTAAKDDDTAAMLGEAWRDGTILTTFVQLFESLAGPTNRQGLKLPALESSIIILDEPQALPKDWWGAIQRLLELLTTEYNARVIAMTATQPSLVRNRQTQSLLEAGLHHDPDMCHACQTGWSYDDPLPAAPKQQYYSNANRVRYSFDSTALSRRPGVEETHLGYDTAVDRILEATNDGESSLAICNTIESSRTLTEVLERRPGVTHLGNLIETVLTERNVDSADPNVDASAIADEVRARVNQSNKQRPTGANPAGVERRETPEATPETYLLTLNSRYRPFDREILIELAAAFSTTEERFVLVSTQVIEAGVDLSFKTVFRDIAPLDSIVQAAGRCNRSYEWGENGGNVFVWMLGDPNAEDPSAASTEPPAYYVYEKGATDAGIPGHLELISEVFADLPGTDDVADAVVAQDAVTAYFDALEEKSLWSTDLRDAIEDANAGWLGQQSLIGGVQTLDVLVALTKTDQRQIENISNLVASGDPAGYEQLQEAAGIRVSLPKPVVEDTPQLVRIDKKERDSDGVQVFQFTGGGGLEYDLAMGGLSTLTDDVSSQFTF